MARHVVCMMWLGLAAGVVSAQGTAGQEARRTPVVIAVEKAGPAVVNISTEKIVTMRGTPFGFPRGPKDNEWFEEFWRRYPQGRRYKTRSLGSGVLMDRRGYIITNAHVVHRASLIRVSLLDKRVFAGELISMNPKLDLAVIRIKAGNDLPTLNMGTSDDLYIGETVIAVGNPFGYTHSVTTGVLSAKDRTIKINDKVSFEGLLQTDASINPGNSGGALLNINGELIGICTAMRAGAENIGFAVPVDTVKAAMVDLLDFRRLKKTRLGMGLIAVRSRRTGLRVGLRVNALDPDGPAESGGLKIDDIITTLDGEDLLDIMSFEIAMLQKEADQEVAFEVLRGGVPVKVPLKVGRLPMPDVSELIRRRTGLVVEALDDETAAKTGLARGGLLVTGISPRTPAAQAGLKTADVIQMFDNYRISRPEDLGALLQRLPTNGTVVVILVRKGIRYYTAFKVR